MGNSLFNGIENEEAARDFGKWMVAGHYLARIERVRADHSEKHNCDYVAVDMTILHTFEDGELPVIAGEQGPKDWKTLSREAWHRPGTSASVQYLGKYKSAKRNLKAFLANATGENQSAITEAACAEIVGDNLLAGTIVELTNTVIAKQNDGGPFTKVWCNREVPASECATVLEPEIAKRFFPDGFEELIKAEGE